MLGRLEREHFGACLLNDKLFFSVVTFFFVYERDVRIHEEGRRRHEKIERK